MSLFARAGSPIPGLPARANALAGIGSPVVPGQDGQQPGGRRVASEEAEMSPIE
jgi:hypothetical protein